VDDTCYIGNIVGSTVANSNSVLIDTATGQLGTNPSSERFKKGIGPMDKSREAIFSLKPVTFRYKDDKTSTPQFGLVAEEVAKVNPALITMDEGKPYSVRYDKVDAMLLNEFLKEHQKVQEQQKEIETLKAELREQRDLIQKVSDKVEMSDAGPKVVASKP
jgi:Chaperone of endosialidase